MKKVLFLACALFFVLSKALYAQPNVVFTSYVTGFSAPVKVTNANDNSNRLFVVEQGGTIRIIKNGTLQAQPFLDISAKTEANGEQGLLSVAFPPRFRQHRFFFVYYTDLNGNVTVARYQVSATNADSAVVTSEKILLNLPKPGGFTNHNGGDMHFGKDNFLYITIGDGGSGGDPFNNSQDGNSLFGKMLRLNVIKNSAPYYSIPATNPFVNDPAVRDEIYALGLRNPWRWSFDRLTGDVWIADVGQDKFEEVNYLTPTNAKGANYGWRCYEGNSNYNLSGCAPSSNYDFPIFAYGHNFINGGYSITGGYVYRGTQYPSLQGYYLCADFISSNLWKIAPNGSGGWNINRQNCPNSLVGFGEDESGELYALALNGTLYRVSAAASPIPIKQSASTYHSFVFPTVVQNGQITIQTDGVSGQLHILNMNGKMVYQQPVTGTFGNLRIQLPHLTAGTYFVQLLSETSSRQQKIIIE